MKIHHFSFIRTNRFAEQATGLKEDKGNKFVLTCRWPQIHSHSKVTRVITQVSAPLFSVLTAYELEYLYPSFDCSSVHLLCVNLFLNYL